MQNIVIFGDNPIAHMLYEDILRHSSNLFNVVAFTVDESYKKSEEFCGKPLISFQEIEYLFPPTEYAIISTVDAPNKMKSKIDVYKRLKEKNYTTPNYISPLADVSSSVRMGENNLIMAYSCLGADGIMGNANFIRQNSYIGHDFKIGNGSTISPGCSIAGLCEIGDSCYIGIGATIIGDVKISEGSFIGAGAVIIKNTDPHMKYVGNPAKPIIKS